jgi:hypothetical protein
MSALIIKFIQQLILLLESVLDWSQRRKPAKGWTIGMAVTVTIVVALMMVRGIAADQPDQDGDPASKAKSVAVTVPLLIGYQGRLADPGTGEAKPDGDYFVIFSLYDVESGGAALWNESKTVSVKNGVFSTHLGDITPLSISLFNGQALWLGIKVESDAEATPRQVLAVVPYAISLVPGASISGDSGSPIFSVENNSTLALAHAIYGSIPSTSPGGSSTAVRGENKGTGSLGIGVWGSHAGGGWGVYGNTVSGMGVLGSSSSGIGVYGSSNSGTGVYAQSSSGDAFYAAGDAQVTGDLTVNGALNTSKVTYTTPRTHNVIVGSEAFVPGSNVPYVNTYGTGGAYINASGGHALVAPVHLPQGAAVTSFKVFFDDTSSGDMSVFLDRQSMQAGFFSAMATVSSSGTSGYYSLVDNTIFSYLVYAYSTAWDSSLRIKGALITYTLSEAP